MTSSHSDALVFFGATGDLAYKKIFPSLQAMVKRGHLNVPVVGVAKAGWNLDQLRVRAESRAWRSMAASRSAVEKARRPFAVCGRRLSGSSNLHCASEGIQGCTTPSALSGHPAGSV